MNALRLIALCCSWWPIAGLADNQDYLIDAWQTDDGLPNNAVTAMVQSRDGYLWIGTSNGLARFDGVHFKTFHSVDTPELESNRILTLYQDRQGVLWIGTDSGLTCCQDGQFVRRDLQGGLSSPAVLCACEDSQGQLWAGTASGLNRWDQTRFHSSLETEGLPDIRVNAMAAFPGGKLILATGKGLAEFKAARFAPYEPVASVPQGDVRLLLADHEGCLWLADDSALWRINWQTSNQSSRVCAGRISALVQRATGEIWFGTAAGSLRRTAAGAPNQPVIAVEHFPSAITALCEDREGTLWLGTASDGLRRLKLRPMRLITLSGGLGKEEISSLLRTSSGSVWMASSLGALRQWRDHERMELESTPLPESALVSTLSGDTASGVWIGTLGDGLFDWKDHQLLHWSQRDGLSDSDIEVLYSDGHGRTWLGTRNGGLNCLQNGHIRRYLTPWGFTGHFANTITQDHFGRLWIGTTGDGLFRLSGDGFSAYTTHNGLPNDRVHVLLADDDGAMWVGTASGLVWLKDERLSTFSVKDGLPDDGIYQLQDDGCGHLWVGCNRGLYRLGKLQLCSYAQGRAEFIDAVEYGKLDGLPGLQCLPEVQVANSGQRDGSLWFSTSKGLVIVRSHQLRLNPLPPPVILEQMLVDNQSVPLREVVRVPPGKDKIQFKYTALSLMAPEKVRFRCQLAGFDHHWVEVGDSRAVTYAKVPPGHYCFRVLACNNDGVWNQTGASLALAVAPFWWNTVLFKVVLLAVVASIAAGAVRLRQGRLREMEQLRVRLAGDLHDELGSSLWSITLLSGLLQKDGRMGEEARHDVGEIHRIANQASNAIREIVWLINPAFDTMQDMVLRMKDFAGTMLCGVACRIHYDGVNLSRRLDLEFRENVFRSFKETLTNVAKHARASEVEIQLEEQPGLWKLTIRDNGSGFTPGVPTTGFGLKSLRARMARIGGTVQIQSELGKGTTVIFTITLP